MGTVAKSVRVNTLALKAIIDNGTRSVRKIAREAGVNHSLLVFLYNGQRDHILPETADKIASAFNTERGAICLPE